MQNTSECLIGPRLVAGLCLLAVDFLEQCRLSAQEILAWLEILIQVQRRPLGATILRLWWRLLSSSNRWLGVVVLLMAKVIFDRFWACLSSSLRTLTGCVSFQMCPWGLQSDFLWRLVHVKVHVCSESSQRSAPHHGVIHASAPWLRFLFFLGRRPVFLIQSKVIAVLQMVETAVHVRPWWVIAPATLSIFLEVGLVLIRWLVLVVEHALVSVISRSRVAELPPLLLFWKILWSALAALRGVVQLLIQVVVVQKQLVFGRDRFGSAFRFSFNFFHL